VKPQERELYTGFCARPNEHFQAYIEPDALAAAWDHALSGFRSRTEVTGILIGQFYRDHNAGIGFVEIVSIERLKSIANSNGVGIIPEEWARVTDLVADHPRYRHRWTVVGWYHSHLNMSAFLSTVDMRTQGRYFGQPGMVALVFGGSGRDPEIKCFDHDGQGIPFYLTPQKGETALRSVTSHLIRSIGMSKERVRVTITYRDQKGTRQADVTLRLSLSAEDVIKRLMRAGFLQDSLPLSGCRIKLERTGEILFPSQSLKMAKAQDGDELVVFSEEKEITSLPVRVLFLSANPADTSRLRLDEEIRSVDSAIRQSGAWNKFDLKQHWAVRVVDIQGYLLRHRPHIVHFSGHGSKINGILLEDSTGKAHSVSARALSRLFSVLRDDIRCVVLNACYSESQAQAIAKHIECVVGMSGSIGDRAATGFAMAFYQALGYGRSVKTAFELGCVQIDLENLNQQDVPKLLAVRGKPEEIAFVSGD
jgi:proteasome lid subunit RPN8/RPN11